MPQTLERSTFQTSRLLEFFSEKELQMQIGFPKEQWPIALPKELIDNAMDACETAGVLPEIEVTVEPDRLSVRDYGPGLPVKTLKHSLNYLVRASNKAHYVSPSRGQLGNALKCLWAAPFARAILLGLLEDMTMTRRSVGLLVTLMLGLLVALCAAEAQAAGHVSRIGLLLLGSSSSFSSRLDGFRQGLRDLGWVEGQQIALEYRYAEHLDQLPDLAAELVRLPVALILAWGAANALAAKQATTTIPIVFVGVANPIGRGLVPNLAQPGGPIFQADELIR